MTEAIKAGVAAAALALALVGCGGTPIQPGTGDNSADAAITGKVKTALLKDADVRGTAINVAVVRGTVQLSGFVRSEHERRRAEELARQVSGVEGVKNDLRVQQDP